MQTIRIGVVRSRRYCATDGFHVHSDHGAGTMDWARPITPRLVRFWEDAAATAGQLLGGHLMSSHLDGIRPDGHLEGTHLLDERAYPAAAIPYVTDPLVFGRFRHAVVTRDAAGNAIVEGIAVYETVVNSDPPPPGALRPVACTADTRQLELSFTASPRLIG